MQELFRKTLFWWILSLFGFALLTYCYVLAWQGTILYYLFWVGLIVSCFSLLLVMLLSKKKNHILFALFFLGLVVYSIQIYRSPDYFINRDEMMHYQGYNSIIEQGNLNFNHTTFPIVKDYPGLELAVSSISLITGIKSMIAGKILIGLVHSMVLILLWLYLSKLRLTNNVASMGAFLYALNPRYTQFDSMVSYESIGIFFVLLLLYLIQKMGAKREIYLSLLAIIVLFATVITHHLSSYMFLLYAIVLMSVQLYVKYSRKDDSIDINKTFLVLAGVICFGWLIYIAAGSVSYLTLGFKYRIMAILQLSVFGGQGTRIMFEGTPVPVWEIFILRFLYPPVLLILCLTGGYFLFIKERLYDKLKVVLFIFGPVLFLSSWVLVLTSVGSELAYRSWAFLFIGVAYISSIAFLELWGKGILKVFLTAMAIILLIGGFSLGRNEAVRFPASQRYVDNETFYTLPAFAAADWLANYDGKGLKLMGTWFQRDVMGSYGAQYIDHLTTAKFILNDGIDIKTWGQFNYLVIDKRITTITYSVPKNYFGTKLPEIYEEIGYKRPLPVHLLDKFNSYSGMIVVYDNGIVLLNRNIL